MSAKILCAVDNSRHSQEALRLMGGWFASVQDVCFRLIHVSPIQQQILPGEISRVYPEEDQWVRLATSRCESVLDCNEMILKEQGISPDRIEKVYRVESDSVSEDIIEDARSNDIDTIAMGRRGLSEVRRFVLGGVSSRVVQEASEETVWIFEPPVDSSRVLVALDGTPECESLVDHVRDFLIRIPGIRVTLYHIVPPQPATYWDDGHILNPEERERRQREVEKWYAERTERVEEIFAKGKEKLTRAGLPAERIETKVDRMKQGPARDILEMQEKGQYGILVVGRQSMARGKTRAIGGRAFKVMNATKNCMLCMVP